MGKKSNSTADNNSAAKAKAKAPLAPGDRPPRPSHGHKWDEEKQEWVGRGSQDERKAAKLKDTGPREANDGTVLKAWQSMPTELLADWAKREKRPKPYYSNARAWDRSKWRQKVYLQDPKKEENSLEFTPYDDSDSQQVAREHAALLALLKVQGSLPLDKKLPEPYCDIWKSTVSEASGASKADPKAKAKAKAKAESKAKAKAEAKAEAQTPASVATANSAEDAALADEGSATFAPPLRAASQYSSKAEREAAQRERDKVRNKREAIREMKRRANLPAPILLSRKMREQIYKALGLDQAYESVDTSGELEMDDTEASAVTRCVDAGFASAEVMRALAATKEEGSSGSVDVMAERLRQWLFLHLPEDELPEQFAASRGQFTVHTADSKAKATDDAASKVSGPAAEFEAARRGLLTWLRGELDSRMASESSDSEALLASVEAVLFGIDLASASDEEAEEAGENAAIIVSSEGEEFEAVGASFVERWKALWEARPREKEDAKVADSVEPDDDDIATTVGDDRASEATHSVDGFWEDAKDTRAGGAKVGRGRRMPANVPWFGTDAGSTQAVAAEASWPSSSAGQRMARDRAKLPAAKSKDELIKLCERNAVLLIQGETGCGKTTQVGQFLLEADPGARVIVTQPRRVAATSVAQRVADERGERLGEGAVGYSVRGESRLRRDRCRLLFCTNGVLLRRLLGESAEMFSEQTCTHLIIDEVHERSVEIDLLLTLLHHTLSKRPKLRVLLMSATMDVATLAAMFKGNPPVIKIPGRTFPVAQLFLEQIGEQLELYTWSTKRKGASGGGDDGAAAVGPQFLYQLDFSMIAELTLSVVRGKLREAPEDGSVLVFVPGVGEIDRVSREISHQASSGEVFVLPLHGGLPPDQQRRCFEIPAKGGPRKVVVSTNVAETSVTVPDVTVVIDTARERRLQLEPGAVAPCLAESICAKSSLTQRRGRAGRVRAGLCITMLLRKEYEALPAEAPPEIESSALESLCLQVHVCGFDPSIFLSKMPTPPRAERVVKAERMLAKIGATRSRATETDKKEVTALGMHLAALPCDVHIGKLLVVGAFLGVASMAVDVAAWLSVRSPMKNVARDPKSESWRESLRQSLRPGGTKSDHCFYAKLMQLWRDNGRSAARRELCQNAALVWERMAEAASVRSQLVNGLRGLGFEIGRGDDRSAGEWRALRVAVTAAFYPQIAKVNRPPPEFTEGLSGAIEKQAEAKKLRYFVQVDSTEDPVVEPAEEQCAWREQDPGSRWSRDTRAFLHPASFLFKETSYSCPWVVFSSKQVQQTRGDYSTKLNLSEASEASIYALLLFGGSLKVDHGSHQVKIDGWIALSGGSTTVVVLMERLRTEIDKLLLQKIEEPHLQLGGSPVCQAVSTLLSTDGLG